MKKAILLFLFFHWLFINEVFAQNTTNSYTNSTNSTNTRPGYLNQTTSTNSTNSYKNSTPTPPYQSTNNYSNSITSTNNTSFEKSTESSDSVTQKVGDLLKINNNNQITNQVKQIVSEQQKTQDKISEQMQKINSRGGLVRFLFGPDNQALNNLKSQLLTNQEQISQLQELKEQIAISTDKNKIQEAIQSLSQQNFSLQDRIMNEEKSKGILGWLTNLFK